MNKKQKKHLGYLASCKSWLSRTTPVPRKSGSTFILVAVILAVLAAASGTASAAPPPSSISGLVYPSNGLSNYLKTGLAASLSN